MRVVLIILLVVGLGAAVTGIASDVDPTRLHQVLGNLLSNALRHTKPGGWVRVAAATDQAAQGGGIVVSVTDTGRGIAPDDLPHIFIHFYRSADSPGTGLGLAIARHLVVLHGE